MFFLRRSTIVVDCFINDEEIIDLYPIQSANKFIPDWWKKLPPSVEKLNHNNIITPMSTMKYCAGFNNLYSTGIVIPLWSDFFISNSPENQEYQFAHTDSTLTQHDTTQYNNCFNNHFHIKLVSPWLIKEKTGINWIFTELFYNSNKSLDTHRIMPGILDYKYQHHTHINILVKIGDGTRLNFLAGDPIVHLIPLSDKSVKVKTHVITETEYTKLYGKPRVFTNYYNKRKKILQSNEKKCPFGFGK